MDHGRRLQDLPFDVLLKIMSDYPLAELARLATRCREMQAVCKQRLKDDPEKARLAKALFPDVKGQALPADILSLRELPDSPMVSPP